MVLTDASLIEFLEGELAVGSGSIDAATPLFSSGLVDSVSMVMLMSFLEKAGGLVIEPEDINLDNFDTVERIMSYVQRVRV
jgi:acyl carrier protein